MKRKKRTVTVLGSTGSIGRQTLEVLREMGTSVFALSGGRNASLLEEQIRQFHPRICAVADQTAAAALRIAVADTDTEVVCGAEAIAELAARNEPDLVFNSILGTAGLVPTLIAVRAGKDVALSNKETLVAAGETVMREAKQNHVRIIPVDSEHCAIHQCLAGNNKKDVKRLILTCSGGPFFGQTEAELKKADRASVLTHPTWQMGAKITVDSATLMNKGLELIEAMHLFDMQPEKIDIVIHRESIIHSMVAYIDGAVLAQLGVPDMRLCIQYAYTSPRRLPTLVKPLDLCEVGTLSFSEPDTEVFRCLALARRCASLGGNMPCVLSGANESATAAFLAGEIRFYDIPDVVEETLSCARYLSDPSLNEILDEDKWAKDKARELSGKRAGKGIK